MDWKNRVVLITGGRGSFGKKFTQTMPGDHRYTSDNNAEWLYIEGIKKFVVPFEELFKQEKLEG